MHLWEFAGCRLTSAGMALTCVDSGRRSLGVAWRRSLLAPLLGSPDVAGFSAVRKVE
jgi:hypothetical protein